MRGARLRDVFRELVVVAWERPQPKESPSENRPVDAMQCEPTEDATPRTPRHPPLGRRPEGHDVDGDPTSVCGWLTRAAKLEAISVPAFARLARELQHHGADRSLVERAHRARRDEERHARTMRTLAREVGATEDAIAPPAVSELPVRSLFEVARENAIEGCILEAFAALVATHQARWATSWRVRRKLDAIADDEAEHAELAWDVDAWCRARLSAEENAAIDRARADAITAMRAALARAASRSVPASLGEPGAELFDAMLERLGLVSEAV